MLNKVEYNYEDFNDYTLEESLEILKQESKKIGIDASDLIEDIEDELKNQDESVAKCNELIQEIVCRLNQNSNKKELLAYLIANVDNTLNELVESYNVNQEMGASRLIRYIDLEDYVFENYDDDYDFNKKFVGEEFNDNNIRNIIKDIINNTYREDLENHSDLQIFIIR